MPSSTFLPQARLSVPLLSSLERRFLSARSRSSLLASLRQMPRRAMQLKERLVPEAKVVAADLPATVAVVVEDVLLVLPVLPAVV
jgi:hypothetical protein